MLLFVFISCVPSFCLLVSSYFDVLHFVLSYFINFTLLLLSLRRLFSNEREVGGGYGWEEKRSRGRGNCKQGIACEKKVYFSFPIKGKRKEREKQNPHKCEEISVNLVS